MGKMMVMQSLAWPRRLSWSRCWEAAHGADLLAVLGTLALGRLRLDAKAAK